MRFRLALALATVALTACGAAQPPRPHDRAEHPTFTLSVVGTNDVHGNLRSLPVLGGYLENLRAARADDGAVLLLDAGDFMQGTIEGNFDEGATTLRAFATLRYDAIALGNHEFDFGPVGPGSVGDPQGALRARIAESTVPILAANLKDRATGALPAWRNLRASTHLQRGALDIGVVGVLTRETPTIVMPAWFVGLEVTPLAPAIEREARRLRREGARLVIVAAHAGGKCREVGDPRDASSCDVDQELFEVAQSLPPGTVDAIFGGHTHAQMAHFVNGVPMAEAWSRGRGFSRIDVMMHGDRVTTRIEPPTELCVAPARCFYEGRPVTPDAAVSAVIAPALAAAATVRARQLGVTVTEAFAHEQTREGALGNLFATLLLEGAAGADAALVNGGGLRAGLPRGPLDYGHVYELCPFDNALTSVELSAAELSALLVAHLTRERHGVVSIAGLRIVATCGKSGLEVRLERDDGRSVPPETRLRVVTSDYLATGGDELFGEIAKDPARRRIDTHLLRDVLVTSLERRGGSIQPASFFDPTRPRLVTPGARPVRCD